MGKDTINDSVTTMNLVSGLVLAERYRVIRSLGQGGMGSVWLVEDTKLDNHKFAIKMLPPILFCNKRAYALVKEEALISIKLSHPNIATVRAFEEEHGNPFLVMDYIDGQTLDDYLADKGKLAEEEAIRILKPVAEALDYAHTQGVIHRDVKPGNVMIAENGNPYVLDFGIAREIHETMTRVTGRQSSGTLMYMSPEQLQGDEPSSAQDVYSFATMTYECLKGKPPFSRGDIEDQIKHKIPESIVPQFPLCGPGVMAGLSKTPDGRPATCAAVLSGKTKCAAVHGSDHPHPDAQGSAGKALPLAAIALVAVVAIGGWWLVCPNRPNRPTGPTPDTTDQPVAIGETAVVCEPAVEPYDRRELDRKRIEAEVKVADLGRLGKGDGFGEKIAECERELALAKSEYDAERWDGASRAYDVVLKRVESVLAVDADRQRARVAALELDRQGRTAQKAEVDRYAPGRFAVATNLYARARSAFAGMRFAEAADNYELAAKQFQLSVEEAGKERLRRKDWRREGESFTIGERGLDLTMKWCPAGTFAMGSPEGEVGRTENERQHQVTLLRGFWMGETEVTQAQWKLLMDGETVVVLAQRGLAEDMPVNVSGSWCYLRDQWHMTRDEDPVGRTGDLLDNVPVYNMNWKDACSFCRRLTEMERKQGRIPDGYEYRLPTEAEWEYACRAGETTILPGGRNFRILGKNNAPDLGEFAWYGGNSSFGFNGRGILTDEWPEKQYPGGRAYPRAVKRKLPNAWGLYDMLGNMAEWCGDLMGMDMSVDRRDPLGGCVGRYRIVRGGAWCSIASDCRPAQRSWSDPNHRGFDVGFRVVLSVVHDGYPFAETQLTPAERERALKEANAYAKEMDRQRKSKDEFYDERLAEVNFCSHCRASLREYAKTPRKCPQCGHPIERDSDRR